MKLIIDVDEKLVCEGFIRTLTEEERDILIRAIGNGVKYVEPKKGEWIVKTQSTFPQYQPNEYECPFCHTIVNHKTNVCHHCGADMRGDKE